MKNLYLQNKQIISKGTLLSDKYMGRQKSSNLLKAALYTNFKHSCACTLVYMYLMGILPSFKHSFKSAEDEAMGKNSASFRTLQF